MYFMLLERIVFAVSTTESAISEQGILPENEAPVYPYITFIKNLIASCLVPNTFLIVAIFSYYSEAN